MASKKKVKVTEHSGDVHTTEVSGFNAQKTHEEIKAAQSIETSDHVVVIGDVIIDARNIRSVTLAE